MKRIFAYRRQQVKQQTTLCWRRGYAETCFKGGPRTKLWTPPYILHSAGYCVSAKKCFLYPGSFINFGFLEAGSTVPLSQTGLGLVNPTGLKFVKPLRSYSVPGSGKRPEKSAMPLALPLRYSSVQSNAVTNSISYRWTRALRVPTLPMLSCVLWPEDMRNFVPHSTHGGVWEPKQ